MSLSIGIIGLPNVGKSTLFKALTRSPVDISNYPFCTIEPNIGIVKVPDERLEKLAEISKSRKIIPAVVEFVDIAGLVKGAAEGEGLGNKFLSHIREVDAVAQVVRVFQNEKITHVHNKIDPEHDIEIINTELILADLETVQKVKSRLEKDIKGQRKEAVEQLKTVNKIKENLESGKLANNTELDYEDETVKKTLQEMSLLTMKPFLYVYNVSDTDESIESILAGRNHVHPVKSAEGGAALPQFNGVKLDIKIEEELNDMSTSEAKELEIKSSLHQLIVRAYNLLDLITFLTTGEDETRAWTIKRESTTPEAGAAIHTDFQEKFIRADVINWEKLLEAARQSAGKDPWTKARELGWLRTEGKEYVVQDGDVIEFKI